jgi:hypothetical protein
MRHILSSALLFAALVTTAAAHADSYSYSYTGTGVSGSGIVDITPTANEGEYQVLSMGGEVNGMQIARLLPVGDYKDNDNLFFFSETYLDEYGVSFQLTNDAKVNIYYQNGDWFFQGDENFILDGGGLGPAARRMSFARFAQTDTTIQLDSFSFAPVAQTPEPSSLVLLGTGAMGLAGIARRRFTRV